MRWMALRRRTAAARGAAVTAAQRGKKLKTTKAENGSNLQQAPVAALELIFQ